MTTSTVHRATHRGRERRRHPRRRWDDALRTRIRGYEAVFPEEARRDRELLVRLGEAPEEWAARVRRPGELIDHDLVRAEYERWSLAPIDDIPAISLVPEYVLWLLFAHDARVRDTIAYQRFIDGMPSGIRARARLSEHRAD
jgi:hypothetical protein